MSSLVNVGEGPSDRLLTNQISSRWNYSVPGIGLGAWVFTAMQGLLYLHYHSSAYETKPAVLEGLLSGIKATAIIGASTIPASVIWTVGRSIYCCTESPSAAYEAFRRSFSWPGEPEAVFSNTLAAPFAAPFLACWIWSSDNS